MRDAERSRRAYRRHVGVLYADLSDSTALTNALEPEDYLALYEQLHAIWERVVQRHGGVVTQVRGDGIVALFGLDSREDESRRAIEAALELHAAVRAIETPLPPPFASQLTLHSGVESGLVLVVEGDGVEGRFVPIGLATNTAARLSDEAVADEILVSEHCLGADESLYRTGPLRSLQLKGRSQALRARAVLGHSSLTRRFEARLSRARSPLCGRTDAVRRLEGLLDDARAGTPRQLEVVGPPGIGKTRLVDTTLARWSLPPQRSAGNEVATPMVLVGYCESYLAAAPLQPLRQCARALDALLVGADPQLQPAVTAQLAANAVAIRTLAQGDDAEPAALNSAIDALVALFGALAAAHPLVLFIDDWQWADDATRRVVAALWRAQPRHLLLLTATREPSVDRAAATQLELQPLSDADCERVIDAIVPDCAPHQRSWLQRSCGGNPFYLEELCQAARDGGVHAFVEHTAPATLELLVESRVAALPAHAVTVLQAAAVVGPSAPRWLLAALVGDAALDRDARLLEERDLLFFDAATDSYRFTHGVTRAVVFDTIALPQRRRWHASCVAALDARHGTRAEVDALEALALHACEAQDHARGAALAERAGDRALAAAALERARDHYGAALRALDAGAAAATTTTATDARYAAWMRVSQRLAMACLYDARREHLGVFERAAALAQECGDDANLAQAEYRLAYIHYALGEPLKSIAHGERALTIARLLGQRAFAAQLEATIAQARASAGENAGAIAVLDASIAARREVGNGNQRAPRVPQALAYSLAARGMALGDVGRFAEAQADFAAAAELLGNSGHEVAMSITSMHAGVCLWQGRFDEALALALRTVQLGQRNGSQYMVAIGTSLAGHARWQRDGAAIGLTNLARGTHWLLRQDQHIWTAMQHGWLALAFTEQQRTADARKHIAWALRRARAGERLGVADALTARALLLAGIGEHRSPDHRVTAASCFLRARANATARGSRREIARIDLAEAQWHRQYGDARTVRVLAARALAEFDAMAMPWFVARAAELS